MSSSSSGLSAVGIVCSSAVVEEYSQDHSVHMNEASPQFASYGPSTQCDSKAEVQAGLLLNNNEHDARNLNLTTSELWQSLYCTQGFAMINSQDYDGTQGYSADIEAGGSSSAALDFANDAGAGASSAPHASQFFVSPNPAQGYELSNDGYSPRVSEQDYAEPPASAPPNIMCPHSVGSPQFFHSPNEYGAKTIQSASSSGFQQPGASNLQGYFFPSGFADFTGIFDGQGQVATNQSSG